MQPLLFIICSLLIFPCLATAQEENIFLQKQGNRYIELNLKALEKYSRRVQQEQQKLLTSLSHKEKKLLWKLKKEDSTAYTRLQSNPLSYDSIRILMKADSNTRLAKTRNKADAAVDSLKKVQQFLQSKAAMLNNTLHKTDISDAGTGDYSSQLDILQTDLNYQTYISRLIDQKTASLKEVGGGKPGLLAGIQKDVFYAKAKIKTWKQLADNPDKAEQKALEWLQGTEGFDKAFQQSSGNNMHSAANAEELERMGFQTKRQTNTQLKKQFGDNTGNVQIHMGQQVDVWQQAQGITGNAQGVQQDIKNMTSQLKETKQHLTALKKTPAPNFKVNPMRGLPLLKRIEKSYTWQTKRASPDGKQPAALELAGMVGYKHSPKLTTGVGMAANIGLGQNWNNIRFSLHGIGCRFFASWEWQYGIAAYAGYERQWKQIGNWQLNNEVNNTAMQPTPHHTARYSETVLLGISKRYRINNKWNGAVQLLCDVWWKEKGMRTPLMVRLVTTKM